MSSNNMASMQQLMALASAVLLPLIVAVGFLIFLREKRLMMRISTATCGGGKLPPGDGGLPLVGETLAFLRALRDNRLSRFVEDRVARHGSKVFRTSLFGMPTVVMYGPEANRFLFSQDGRLLRPFLPRSATKLLGNSFVATGDPPQHRRIRRLLMACLLPDVLRKVTGKVDTLTRSHVRDLWLGRARVGLHRLVTQHTLEVACRLLVGVQEPARIRELARLFARVNKGVVSLPVYLPGTRYFAAHRARARLVTLLGELVAERRNQLLVGSRRSGAAAAAADDDDDNDDVYDDTRKTSDFLSLAVAFTDEDGRPFSDPEIIDMLIALLFAGHETVTSAICMACKFLSENPACCDEVRTEQMTIKINKKENDTLNWEDLQKMRYTWNVIQESMRLQPPIFGLYYIVVNDFQFDQFIIPREWLIFHSTAQCNLDEHYFPNSMIFDPSRFDGKGPKMNTFVPFGGGPHFCAGMDFAKMISLVFVHNLVTSLKWKLVDPSEQVSATPTPFPVNGFSIMIEELKISQ